jgi:nitrite reductase (NADH) small subunit
MQACDFDFHATPERRWVDVCAIDDIVAGSARAALVDGEQIAIVRSPQGDCVYALSNFDPFSKAFVLARGIVGDKAGRLKLVSPMYKQSFDVVSGACFDDPAVSIATYPARVLAGRIQVGVSEAS